VKFGEKLKKLTEGMNRSEISRRADLPSQYIANYITRDSIPSASIALSLARALDVPVEWLIDDQQDFPPPKTGTMSLKNATDAELIEEVETRYQRAAVALLDTLEKLKSMDLSKLAREIAATPPDKPLSKAADAAKQLIERRSRHKCEVIDFIALGSTTGGWPPHPRYAPEQLAFEAMHAVEQRLDRSKLDDLELAVACRDALSHGSVNETLRRSSADWIDRFLGRSRS
jgi:transcriptional regulator with XRE-family HTH domain